MIICLWFKDMSFSSFKPHFLNHLVVEVVFLFAQTMLKTMLKVIKNPLIGGYFSSVAEGGLELFGTNTMY